MSSYDEKYARRRKTKITISVKFTEAELAELDALRGPLYDWRPDGDREPRGEVLRRLLREAAEVKRKTNDVVGKTQQLDDADPSERLTEAPADSSYEALEQGTELPAISAAVKRKTKSRSPDRKTRRARPNRKTQPRPNRLTPRSSRKTRRARS